MRGTLLALIACMFFALDPVLSKKLLLDMSPAALTALKAGITGLLLVVGMEALRKIRELTDVTKHDVFMLFLVGLFGGALGHMLVYIGLTETSVTNTVLLTRVHSLILAMMAAFFLKEKITRQQIVGGLSMLIGMLFIVLRGFTIGYRPYAGDLYILAGAFCWAVANIIMKKYLSNIRPEVIVSFRNIVGGLILLAFVYSELPEINYSSQTLSNLILLAFAAVAIPQLLWYKSMELTKASNVGLTSLTMPLFAAIYAVILLGEQILAYQLIGGLLILFGLMMLELHAIKHWVTGMEHRLKTHHLFHH